MDSSDLLAAGLPAHPPPARATRRLAEETGRPEITVRVCSVRTFLMFGACSVARRSICGYILRDAKLPLAEEGYDTRPHAGCEASADVASKFSRKDHATLPQLFACLVLRQFYDLSYRRAEALIKDSQDLRDAIEMKVSPDHNTLHDAFDKLVKIEHFAPMLDELAMAFEELGLLKLDEKPLATDSTHFEPHHVSRHFAERKKRGEEKKVQKNGKSRKKAAKSKTRSKTVKTLPKLAIAVACGAHLILSMWSGTGMGADHPHFETLVYHAWRRANVDAIVADAGYDSEDNHRLARLDMNCRSFIPPLIERPSQTGPKEPFRAMMKQIWETPEVLELYHQRWQVETVNSMMKRNYGSALRSKTAERREREMLLKAMTHNIAI